jgi:5'-3' exonuclease
MCGKFEYEVAAPGLEADDAICIYQSKALAEGRSTIICSRDKDLRQCKGWHYSWECGHQASVGPLLVDELGSLTNRNQGKVDKLGKNKPLKVLGTGSKFFYYQLLTGDSTDNIQGIMGRGPAFAYNLLKDVATDRECYELVAEVYVKTYGDVWEEKLREMADLLYIIKDTDEEGNLVKWTKPKMLLLV